MTIASPSATRLRLAAATVAGLLLLSACGSTNVSSGSASNNSGAMDMGGGAGMAADGSMTGDMAIDASGMGAHVHNLAFDGQRLLLGTHEGLWVQTGADAPRQLSADRFDVMGFARQGAVWLASGHPGMGMQAPDNLGLMTSGDQGRHWKTLALSGQADFHRLVAAGRVIMGISSGDGHLLRSVDSGRTWSDLGANSLYDLAIAPNNTARVIGTMQQGLQLSVDGGKTFSTIKGAPLLALLAVNGTTMVGFDVYGKVFTSTDNGDSWTKVGAVPSQPSAIAASGDRMAALVGSTVYLSTDGGKHFFTHLRGVEGH